MLNGERFGVARGYTGVEVGRPVRKLLVLCRQDAKLEEVVDGEKQMI